jgi:CDP-6-deoxy-D-xylo-4-hexulose-3-dehydrase
LIQYKLSDDTWSNSEIQAINRVIKSKRFTMGKEVQEYEEQFAKKMGSRYAIMSNSGSSANLLAVASLVYSEKLSAGDEILVPAVSWSTTYFPICQHNLKLRFIDIDVNTLNIDLTKIENSITNRTKAIMVVNLLGNPNKYEEILNICKKYNLILIEDNCESLGGKYKKKQLGSFGVLGTYSTFFSHHLCTMEGGITTTDDEELYHYMLSIRAHGWTRNLPTNSKIYEKKKDDFYESFNFIVPGYNIRPIEMEAAIGKEQLKKIDIIVEQRRKNAKYFIERIKKINNVSYQKEIEESSWFGFAIILKGKNKGKRSQIVQELIKNNVEVRPIVAGNFTKNIVIKYMDYTIYGSLKNADNIHENGFFVGNHSRENKKQVNLLMDILEMMLNNE